MIERREGQTIGQPPKYIGYEDDLYKVVTLLNETTKSGGLIYECECKLCGGMHKRTSHQLGRGSRSRECPEYKAPNWSGYDREDQIMRRTYGISMQEFDELVEFQGGKCAICFKPLDAINRRANIDHCHDTGKVRGILCTGCNTGIGHLGDNIEGLKKALYYLENTPFEEYSNAR
jgi:hypothetical protein